MRAQRVLSPAGVESWTVIGDDHRPIPAVESYLAWLSDIERSPNTVRAYAMDLKCYWTFLQAAGVAWDAVTLELIGRYTAWLRQPADNVLLLPAGRAVRAASTVNRMLAAVYGLYDFHARHGVEVAKVLIDQSRSGHGGHRPFLHGIVKAKPAGRIGRLREPRRLPKTLELEQVAAIIHSQRRLRDRFLFALLSGTGMRIGQALGLRHEDFVTHERRIEIVPRQDNVNGARGKGGEGAVPVSGQLVRCYSDYMHEEYGDLDCDYVFVNLWGGRIGRPMTYANVVDIVARTRARVGFEFSAHMLRHTYATMARRGGVPMEVISALLTHRSVQTTSDIYVHYTAEDLRAELTRAGVMTDLERAL